MKTYSPGGAKAIEVYDAASNCLTLACKQNENNYKLYP